MSAILVVSYWRTTRQIVFGRKGVQAQQGVEQCQSLRSCVVLTFSAVCFSLGVASARQPQFALLHSSFRACLVYSREM